MNNIFKRSIASLLAILICLSIICFNVSAEDGCWYIKRNGNKRPFFPDDAEELKCYDAYYIDEKLSENSENKKLYITFDAGYENGNIEKILDILKNEGVPAAFFLLDNIILKNTDLVKRMAEEGHLVCNHTKNHKDLSFASEEEIAQDLLALEKIYNDSTGYEMEKYFRFPEGKYSKQAICCVQKLGYKTIFWSFAYDDWDNGRQPNEKRAMKKILDNTHNGAVILLHPTSATNTSILPALIKAWRDMGYEFGTLDELTTKI